MYSDKFCGHPASSLDRKFQFVITVYHCDGAITEMQALLCNIGVFPQAEPETV